MRRLSGFRVGCLARKSMATISLVIISEITPEGEIAWEWHYQSDMEIEISLEPFTSREEFAHANSIFYTRMIAI